MTLILIFGVSGVGKTTVCRSLAATRPEFKHLSASELIARETGLSTDQLRRSAFEQVKQNQIALGHALRRYGRAQTVLLDGQCLIDNGRELIALTAEDIAAFRPKGIVLVESPPEALFSQRSRDARFRPERSVDELQEQLQINRNLVAAYAAELDVPYRVVAADNLRAFESAVDGIRHSL